MISRALPGTSFLATRTMTIYINKTETEVSDGITVGEVLRQMQFPESDIAVAVDNKVVPRALWDSTQLQTDARLTVIRAVCGG